ncbi:MAG TPA: hypothetical protein VLM79_21040 [Kofleriaceae bacterium]|nr:hypothetical protein [Kofleriaceae bacterium]
MVSDDELPTYALPTLADEIIHAVSCAVHVRAVDQALLMRLCVIGRLMAIESLCSLARNNVRSGLAISAVAVAIVRATRVDPIVALRAE